MSRVNIMGNTSSGTENNRKVELLGSASRVVVLIANLKTMMCHDWM